MRDVAARVTLALGLAAGLLAGASGSAWAGTTVIAGKRMSCHGTTIIVSNAVPGPGFALTGTILLSPKYLSAYPPLVQRLVFLHECGHQYVGLDESDADCWAVRAGKRQGWLKQSGLAQACKAIWHTQADGAHLSGPERCAVLKQCYETAP